MGGKGKKYQREEALKNAENIISKLDGINKYKICGSIRRKKEIVGDIDIVVILENQELFFDSIDKLDGIHILSKGNRNIRFILKHNGIQVDIMVVEPTAFESAILHLTGSKYFNIRCRAKARALGYVLNEYGLWDVDGNVITTKEKDILRMLEMEKYIDPTNR